MLTVNVNNIRCDNTIGDPTIKPATAKNISCTLTNVTDMLKMKSLCDNEIKYLFIKGSNFDVFPHVFEFYPKLECVDIQFARIQHIESTTFDTATHLTTLDIGGSNMKTLSNSLFTRVNNLTSFDMGNSSIEIIEKYAFHGLSNLKKLDLSNNKIVALEAEIFQPLSRLETLRLENNKIQVIDNQLFIHNVQLRWAYFSANDIIIVQSNAFVNCQLKTLDLGLNQLHDLDLTTTKYLKSLTVTGNKLNVLKVPSVVEEIYAENNSISMIYSEEKNELTRLFLSSNYLTNSQNWTNFGKLQFLDLSSNHLRNFTLSALKPLTLLKELKLCGNKLAEINADDVITNLPKLHMIELSTKHWSDSFIDQLENDLKNHSILLGQDRSIISDDVPVIPTVLPTPVTPSTPSTPTLSPDSGIEQQLKEIGKKLSDLEYKMGANSAADSKRIDGRLLAVEDKLTKSNADNNAKYESMASSFKLYEALVIIMFVCGSIFVLYKVIVYSKNVVSGMRYRRAQSSDPIFSEQDL